MPAGQREEQMPHITQSNDILGALFIFAALRIGDVLHNVQSLSAALRAGVAADAGIDFGIELHHDLLVRTCTFSIS